MVQRRCPYLQENRSKQYDISCRTFHKLWIYWSVGHGFTVVSQCSESFASLSSWTKRTRREIFLVKVESKKILITIYFRNCQRQSYFSGLPYIFRYLSQIPTFESWLNYEVERKCNVLKSLRCIFRVAWEIFVWFLIEIIPGMWILCDAGKQPLHTLVSIEKQIDLLFSTQSSELPIKLRLPQTPHLCTYQCKLLGGGGRGGGGQRRGI